MDEPLLPKTSPGKASSRSIFSFGPGSVGSTIVLLSSGAIGTGVLALPYGVKCVGVLPAMLLFALAGVAAISSNVILFDCVQKTGHGSYGELMSDILGKYGAMVLDFFVCVEGIGAVSTYLVFIMDYVPQVCALGGEDLWCRDQTKVLMAVTAIAWPLSCLRGLSALRYTSTCSLFTILLTSMVVIGKAPGLFAKRESSFLDVMSDVNVNLDAFQVLSMACFAFMTHTNTPEIALCFKAGKTAATKALRVHTILLWAVYCAIAVCGYISFVEDVSQDFLTNYDVKDLLIVLCRCLLSTTLTLACPINMFPAMQALFNILEGLRTHPRASGEETLYNTDAVRVPVTTGCFALALGIALKSPHVADLISLISSYVSSPLMFAFPAVMYWRVLGRKGMGLPVSLLLLTATLWLAELFRSLRA